MQIGVAMAFSQHTPPGFVRDAAQLVESLGFSAIWVPEHVLFFPEYASTYPYSDSGRIPGDPVGLLDPFTTLAFIAGHTQRVRLATGICLVPQRQPVYTAKMVADVDFLSNGRLDFGVGVGWLKEEFDSLGVDFSRRGALCDEYIDAMKALWADGVTRFEGRSVTLEDCHFNPKPVQRPHPPIIFGGESDAALRRVARHGNGWYGYDLAPDMLAEKLPKLEAALAREGRRREEITLVVGPNRHPVNPRTVEQYRRLGVDQLVVPLGASSLEKLSERAQRLLVNVGAA